MAERRNRFMNLEGARPAGPASSPQVSDRFRAPAEPDAEKKNQDEAIDQLQAARRSQLESGLSLDLHSDDEQPFTRCGQCETDTFRGATRCKTCGAQLDTPMQRAFNEALWQKRKAEQAQEGAQLKAQQRAGPAQSITPEQRAYGEALARQVRERETTRLSWMHEESSTSMRPIGMRLLEKIPSPAWRLVTACGLVLLGLILGWNVFKHSRGEQNPFALLGFIILLGLFLPSRRRGFFSRGGW